LLLEFVDCESGAAGARHKLETSCASRADGGDLVAHGQLPGRHTGEDLVGVDSEIIEQRKNARPPPQPMRAYVASHEKYGGLYKKLAE